MKWARVGRGGDVQEGGGGGGVLTTVPAQFALCVLAEVLFA